MPNLTRAWNRLVPKDLLENLAFRRSLIEQGDADEAIAEQLWRACAQDILFYLNAFCWVFEPRTKKKLPFITWPFQDRAIRKIQQAIHDAAEFRTEEDRFIEKARDMGASWICLAVFEHEWHFSENASFLLGSRKEELVDKPGDPRALMWKLDFIHEHLPEWLLPTFTRTNMHFHNEDNNSTIDGESTNENFARGDRRTAILLDEFAAADNGHQILKATADATDCRIFNTTPQGTGNAAYEVRERMLKFEPEHVLRLSWLDHPHKAAGLYGTAEDGKLRILDKAYKFPEEYNFILDGKTRSVWYDSQCRRRHPQEIAQEIEINWLGSDSQFFEEILIKAHIREHTILPLFEGDIEYTQDEFQFLRFVEQKDGPCRIWSHLDYDGRPPQDRDYAAGIDISSGAGASNSVIMVGDKKTNALALEYAHSRMLPEKFAELAVVIARWFAGLRGGAYMVWEANGGNGSNFGDRVLELGYRNFYYRTNELSLSKKVSDTPGWWSTPVNKKTVLGEFRRAMMEARFLNRSERALNECSQYVYTRANTVQHVAETNQTIDPSGAGAGHGDRVIACALCVKGMAELGEPPAQPAMEQVLEGSFAWRRARRQMEAQFAERW